MVNNGNNHAPARSAGGLDYDSSDFDHSPLVVFYEVTRACNLLCRHCRAEAQPRRHPLELDTRTALALLADLKRFPKPPLLVFTGGDPIKRADVFDLVRYGVESGLKVAMTPSATKLVTPAVVRGLQQAGLHRLAVSLDGADAATHDGFRRVPGSYERTLEIMRDAIQFNLPLQINTTIARHNFDQIDAMACLLGHYPITLWSVFFLVPTGRALADSRIFPEEYEIAFEKLYQHTGRHGFGVKTTEAPHYRRFILEKQNHAAPAEKGGGDALPGIVGTNDGRGVMFISHIGEIFPSGFLPILCGRFPHDSAVAVYQHSPLFGDLRNPGKLKGKCGFCRYRDICGGSRARAYGLTGDPLAAEPDCIYGSPRVAPQRSLPPCLA